MYGSVDYWTATDYVNRHWLAAVASAVVYLIYGSRMLTRNARRGLKLNWYALLDRWMCLVSLGNLVLA